MNTSVNFPYAEVPVTWHLNDAVLNDLAQCMGRLQQKGYTLLFGKEIEYVFSTDVKNTENFNNDKAHYLNKLKQSGGSAAEIQMLQSLNARELIMYGVLHDYPTLVEPRPLLDAKKLMGEGYYDYEDVLEVRVRKAEPMQFIAADNFIRSEFLRRQQHYGLHMEDEPKRHLSYSVWKDGVNQCDSKEKN